MTSNAAIDIIKWTLLLSIVFVMYFTPALAFYISSSMLLMGDVSMRALNLAPWGLFALVVIFVIGKCKLKESIFAIFTKISKDDGHPVQILVSRAHITFMWIVLCVAALSPQYLTNPLVWVAFVFQALLLISAFVSLIIYGVPRKKA